MHEQARAIAALLDTLQLERVVVAALSAGGLAALQFALKAEAQPVHPCLFGVISLIPGPIHLAGDQGDLVGECRRDAHWPELLHCREQGRIIGARRSRTLDVGEQHDLLGFGGELLIDLGEIRVGLPHQWPGPSYRLGEEGQVAVVGEAVARGGELA